MVVDCLPSITSASIETSHCYHPISLVSCRSVLSCVKTKQTFHYICLLFRMHGDNYSTEDIFSWNWCNLLEVLTSCTTLYIEHQVVYDWSQSPLGLSPSQIDKVCMYGCPLPCIQHKSVRSQQQFVLQTWAWTARQTTGGNLQHVVFKWPEELMEQKLLWPIKCKCAAVLMMNFAGHFNRLQILGRVRYKHDCTSIPTPHYYLSQISWSQHKLWKLTRSF